MRRHLVFWAAIVGATLATCALADDAKTDVKLKVGDKAPEFTATDDANDAFESKNVYGKGIVVVYFYPADFTGGCTKQACGFRDQMSALKELGVTVIGVSGDSVATHQKFKKQEELNFTLLSDGGEVARAFGVPFKKWGESVVKIGDEKVTVTRDYTAERWTFVIDKEGKIAHVASKVNAANDPKEVLAIAKKLAEN